MKTRARYREATVALRLYGPRPARADSSARTQHPIAFATYIRSHGAVEDRARKVAAPEVRHISEIRPAQRQPPPQRVTTQIDLAELARLTAASAQPEIAEGPSVELSLDHVPRLRVSRQVLLRTELDRREAFLISLIDDVSTVGMIVEVAGMAEELTLATLHQLYVQGIIDLL